MAYDLEEHNKRVRKIEAECLAHCEQDYDVADMIGDIVRTEPDRSDESIAMQVAMAYSFP